MTQKISFYVFVITFCIGLISCSEMSEYEVLQKRITELESYLESHNTGKINNYLAKDFSAGKGFNKARFTLFIRYHLQKNKNIVISRSNETIKLSDTRADVTADILLLGASSWIPERGRTYQVESRWVKESGLWVMSRLRWTAK